MRGFNLKTAVQDGKVMQDFELESLVRGGDHSQKVKAPPLTSDYGSKDCVNLPSSTAVFRFKWVVGFTLMVFMGMLFFVTVAAFMRKSGNTGLDMAKIHHLRDKRE